MPAVFYPKGKPDGFVADVPLGSDSVSKCEIVEESEGLVSVQWGGRLAHREGHSGVPEELFESSMGWCCCCCSSDVHRGPTAEF